MIKAAIEAQSKARFDRSHFASMDDSALRFESVYFVTNAAYSAYMDTQQAINLRLFREFAEEGIDFAYPTRTVWLEGNKQAAG